MERSNFTDIIVRENGLDLMEWALCPGMDFGSSLKWWADRGRRQTAHEGLDLLLYRTNKGKILRLNENTKIPAMYDGTVVKVIDDFIGRSIFMEHELKGNLKFITAFGHTHPLDGIEPGSKIKEGDIMATIAGINEPKVRIAPHLHISAGWVPSDPAYEDLTWETMGSAEMIKLIDPLDLIGGDAERLAAGSTECNSL